jgi:competence protein ComEC
MWSQLPMLRLIIPLIVGIMFAEYLADGVMPQRHYIIGAGLLVMVFTFFYSIIFGFKSRWIFGILLLSFFAVYAFYITSKINDAAEQKQDEIIDSTRIYLAVIAHPFQPRERSCRGRIRVLGVGENHQLHPVSASLMLYTEPDSLLPEASAGTMILFYGSLRLVSSPANPAEFNYKDYLRKQGIYHTAFLKKGQWKLLSQRSGFNIRYIAEAIRGKLLQKLSKSGFEDGQFAVAAALLLGEDQYLDSRLRNIYASAGAMHILCVSGLHVGVIFLVMSFGFGFLKQFRLGRLILPVLLILSIWCYALITGLAPPVKRASIMISFIIVGNTLKRHKNVYNTLASSAFLMLLLDPHVIFGTGFQLSYTAVLGIISMQRPVYNLLYFKRKIPDKVWAITSVSIAAQLGTLPLVLYYFHQFPAYALLTNLMVIPISSLIIYTGIAIFILPCGTYVSYAAACLLRMFITVMDHSINLVESLPFAVIQDISIDRVMLYLLYLILIFLFSYLILKKKGLLFAGLIFTLIFSFYRLAQDRKLDKQKHLIIYSINGHSSYDVILGRKHFFYADSNLMESHSKINYSIKPNWLKLGLSEPSLFVLPAPDKCRGKRNQSGILQAGPFRVLYFSGSLPHCLPPAQKLSTDLLILRGRGPFCFDDLLKWFDPAMVIIDSSVPPWVEYPDDQKRVWAVREKGAYFITLP